jgi:hypothetical protein
VGRMNGHPKEPPPTLRSVNPRRQPPPEGMTKVRKVNPRQFDGIGKGRSPERWLRTERAKKSTMEVMNALARDHMSPLEQMVSGGAWFLEQARKWEMWRDELIAAGKDKFDPQCLRCEREARDLRMCHLFSMKCAAPYCHPRLSRTMVKVDGEEVISTIILKNAEGL